MEKARKGESFLYSCSGFCLGEAPKKIDWDVPRIRYPPFDYRIRRPFEFRANLFPSSLFLLSFFFLSF